MVGFEVEARSVDINQLNLKGNTCTLPSHANPQFVNPKGTKLLFLYSVKWKQSDVSWASRWDIYLGMSDVEIHWFSIINSLIVVLFLSGKYILLFAFDSFQCLKLYGQYSLIKLHRNFNYDHGSNSKKGYCTLQRW